MNTESNGEERRRGMRVRAPDLNRPVALTPLVPGRESFDGELVDVSESGIAVWLPTEIEAGSHWLLTMAETDGAAFPVKMVRARPGYGGFIHAFKFSTHQATLVERLSGRGR